MSQRQTIGERLDYVNGRPAGFDYMKLSLAVLVVVFHSVNTTYGQEADYELWNSPLRPFARAVLPMFFGVSGFLIAASLDRSKTIIKFLGLRVLRIFPALTVEVMLSAFIIGPLLTTYALGAYFSDPLFFSYLLNAVGEVHFLLPGVFADNPHPNTVNATLWTIPFELYAYISLAILALLGFRKRRWLAPLSVVGLTALHLAARVWKHDWQYVPVTGGIPGYVLVIAALAGVTVYAYRDVIPWTPKVFWATTLAAGVWFCLPWGGEYASVLVAYAAVYLGLTDPPRIALVKDTDYSYGIYLYGFVIQQTFVALFPELRHWAINAVVCLAASFVFAMLSWNLIEKPTQKLKGPLTRLENWWLAQRDLLVQRYAVLGALVQRNQKPA
jgi:peptidoglycan/LPS O-acetylase OafA/YrhL